MNLANQNLQGIPINEEEAPQRIIQSAPLRCNPTNYMQLLVLSRLKKDFKEISMDPLENCSAQLRNNDIFKWEATLIGPSDTPYEKGVFKLYLNFTEFYPFRAPEAYFVTKIFHCNVSQQGLICLDILDTQWSPALTVRKLLFAIISLLTDANPLDPINATAAENYMKDRKAHDALARQWTQLYAK